MSNYNNSNLSINNFIKKCIPQLSIIVKTTSKIFNYLVYYHTFSIAVFSKKRNLIFLNRPSVVY